MRLSALAAVLAFGGTGVALALTGAGVPFLLASLLAAGAVGVVDYAALRLAGPTPQPMPTPTPAPMPAPTLATNDAALHAELEQHRTSTAALRHDIRGVLSPALMMSDRLLNHADPAVQRAGQAVVRSVEKATALLATNKSVLETVPQTEGPPPTPPPR